MSDKKISQLTGATTPLAGTEVLPIVQSGATVKVAVSNLTAGRDITASGATFTKAGVTQVTIENTTGTTKNTQLIFADDVGSKWRIGMDVFTNDGTNELQVYSDTATNSPVRISTSGNVTLPYGNLVIGTSGKGIDFSADGQAAGMTSELLDDYEEGAWTPVYSGTGSDPTVTYSVNIGTYAKVGRMVYWSAEITTTAASGGSGNLQIAGFPFACGSRYAGGATVNYANNWTTVAPNVATIFNGATVMSLFANSATTFTETTVSNLTDGVVYLVAFGMYSV